MELEQLEHLCSEDTPTASWLPLLLSHIGSQSKEDKVKIKNFKNLPKFQICKYWNKLYIQHPFGSCLIRCANMKWIQWVLLKIQRGHICPQTDRWRDRQTDKVKPVYPPFNFVEAEGIIKCIKLFISCHQSGWSNQLLLIWNNVMYEGLVGFLEYNEITLW